MNNEKLNFGCAFDKMFKNGGKIRAKSWHKDTYVAIENSGNREYPIMTLSFLFMCIKGDEMIPYTPTNYEMIYEEWEYIEK